MQSFFQFCTKYHDGMWPDLILIGSQIFGQVKPDEFLKRDGINIPKPCTYLDVGNLQLDASYYREQALTSSLLIGQRSGKSYLLRALVSYISSFSEEFNLGQNSTQSKDYFHIDVPNANVEDHVRSICETLTAFKAAFTVEMFESGNQTAARILMNSGFTVVLCDGIPNSGNADYFELGRCIGYISEELAWRYKAVKNKSMNPIDRLNSLKMSSIAHNAPLFISISSVFDDDTFLKCRVNLFIRRATWEVNPNIKGSLLGELFIADPTGAMRDFGSRV
jgi:hypothetical protein